MVTLSCGFYFLWLKSHGFLLNLIKRFFLSPTAGLIVCEYDYRPVFGRFFRKSPPPAAIFGKTEKIRK